MKKTRSRLAPRDLQARAGEVADVLAALSNDRRLMILCTLVEEGEATVNALQTSQMNAQHIAMMGSGADTLKTLQRQVNSETLDIVRDKFEEAMDTHAEIEAAMSETWAAGAATADDADDSDAAANASVADGTSLPWPRSVCTRAHVSVVSQSLSLTKPSSNCDVGHVAAAMSVDVNVSDVRHTLDVPEAVCVVRGRGTTRRLQRSGEVR